MKKGNIMEKVPSNKKVSSHKKVPSYKKVASYKKNPCTYIHTYISIMYKNHPTCFLGGLFSSQYLSVESVNTLGRIKLCQVIPIQLGILMSAK